MRASFHAGGIAVGMTLLAAWLCHGIGIARGESEPVVAPVSMSLTDSESSGSGTLYTSSGVCSRCGRLRCRCGLQDPAAPGANARGEELDGPNGRGAGGGETEAPEELFDTVPESPLALHPAMLGDSIFSGGQIIGFDGLRVIADMPGGRNTKIADNSSPVPQDRLIFMYQRFNNVGRVDSNFIFFPGIYDYGLDQYTLGIEKTFLGGAASIDVRVPLRPAINIDQGNFFVGNGRSSVGNVSIAAKGLLYQTPTTSLSAGVSLGLPTAEDIEGYVNIMSYELDNESVHVAPFVGFLYAPDDRWFTQGFVQVDVDTNGNSLHVGSIFLPTMIPVGVYQDQTLMFVDWSVGRWLYRNPDARVLKGAASLFEVHYTSTLQDTDVVAGGGFMSSVIVTNLSNRVDMLNLTTGLHLELFNGADARIAAVLPTDVEDERAFDFEVNAQVNFHF